MPLLLFLEGVRCQQAEESGGVDPVTITIVVVVVLVCIALMKLAIDNSNKNLNELLPEAEMKLQLAIYKLEERQADKVVRNELLR